jgi:hypothetical protein
MSQSPLPTVHTVLVLLSVFTAKQVLAHNKLYLNTADIDNRITAHSRSYARILQTFKGGNMHSSCKGKIVVRLYLEEKNSKLCGIPSF